MIRSATSWRGQPAMLLSSDQLEAVVSHTGAQLACLRRRGEQLNPLWQPPWQTAEDPLLAIIVGSNPCLDRFGPAWPGEAKPLHGEAGVRRWNSRLEGESAVFSTELPLARLAVERGFEFQGDTLVLTTSVRSLDAVARTIEWCEHTTLGDPFLATALITAGIARPQSMSQSGSQPGTESVSIDAATALAMPGPSDENRGDIHTAPVLDGWYRVHNPMLGRTLMVRWDPADFPWLCLWTEHRSRSESPWLGVTRARGMELSTKPFPEGKPPAERATSWLGRSTLCVVPAHGWLRKTIRFRWS